MGPIKSESNHFNSPQHYTFYFRVLLATPLVTVLAIACAPKRPAKDNLNRVPSISKPAPDTKGSTSASPDPNSTVGATPPAKPEAPQSETPAGETPESTTLPDNSDNAAATKPTAPYSCPTIEKDKINVRRDSLFCQPQSFLMNENGDLTPTTNAEVDSITPNTFAGENIKEKATSVELAFESKKPEASEYSVVQNLNLAFQLPDKFEKIDLAKLKITLNESELQIEKDFLILAPNLTQDGETVVLALDAKKLGEKLKNINFKIRINYELIDQNH